MAVISTYYITLNGIDANKKPLTTELKPNVAKEITIGDKNYSLLLESLEIDKGLYRAHKVNAVLQLTGGTPEEALIFEYFSQYNTVDITATVRENNIEADSSVGKHYLLYDISPEYFSDKSSLVRICLEIYSPDKLFDGERFCRTYTASRLAKDILANAVTEFGLTKVSQTIKAVSDNLNYLSYNSGKDELIQPYLVQYNETFYDFLARCANRCGEFLFYEDEAVQMGLKTNVTVNKISGYKSLSYHRPHKSPKTLLVKGFSRNSTIANQTDADGYKYHNEAAGDEYLAQIVKDAFTNLTDEKNAQTHPVARVFSTLLNSASLTDFITGITWGESLLAKRLAASVKSANSKGAEKYFPSDKQGFQKDQFSTDNKTMSPFSTNPDCLATKLTSDIDNTLLNAIRKAQVGVASTGIEIDFGTKGQNLKIGGIIRFDDDKEEDDPKNPGKKKITPAPKYIITAITGKEKVLGSNWQTTMKVTAVRMYENGDGDEKVFVPCPPAVVPDFIKKSDSQTAFVKDTEDPLRLGRVRLSFPWDSDSAALTPWVRMATPMATNGGGMYFKPCIGDEVIVDYVGGNMEKPMVVGALYSADRGIPYGGRGYSNVISTANGQYIKMSDAAGVNALLSGILPGVGLLKSFVPSAFSKDKAANKFSGSIELTDENGMYSVSMSSAKRSVSVSSPFGDVSLSAYTGISINAPNGNIKIVGKNVDIVAGNNLNLISGKNLDDKAYVNYITSGIDPAGFAGGLATALFVDKFFGKILDIKLVRTLIETFLRPIEGTLSIKSFRFMKLAAGVGKAEIPLAAYKNDTTVKQRITESRTPAGEMEKLEQLFSVVNEIPKYVAGVIQNFQTACNDISEAMAARKNMSRHLPENTKVTSDKILTDGFKAGKGDSTPAYLKTLNEEWEKSGKGVPNPGIVCGIGANAIVMFKKAKAFRPREFHVAVDSTQKEFLDEVYKDCILDSNDGKIKDMLDVDSSQKFDNIIALLQDENTVTRVTNLFVRNMIVCSISKLAADCGLKVNPVNVKNGVDDATFKKFIEDLESNTALSTGKAIGKAIYDTLLQKPLLDNITTPFYDAVAWDDLYGDSRILVSDNSIETGNLTLGNVKTNMLGYKDKGLAGIKSKMKKAGYLPVGILANPGRHRIVIEEIDDNNEEDDKIHLDLQEDLDDKVVNMVGKIDKEESGEEKENDNQLIIEEEDSE